MTEKNDILKNLFSRMPEEELPGSFRANVMQQILAEAERIHKRNERWGWIAVISASLLMSAWLSEHSFIWICPRYPYRCPA